MVFTHSVCNQVLGSNNDLDSSDAIGPEERTRCFCSGCLGKVPLYRPSSGRGQLIPGLNNEIVSSREPIYKRLPDIDAARGSA